MYLCVGGTDSRTLCGGQGMKDSGQESFSSNGVLIKRCLLLGRKVMTNLDIILKSRDITLLTKIHIVKGKVFPVVTLWM